MESLYVCLFSNGHIKVGRSISPIARMASHADRVACMGVELEKSWHTPCEWNAMSAEFALIRKCTDVAARRFQNEWFDGLDFDDVCGWAGQIAASPDADDWSKPECEFGARLRAARSAAGLTQAQLGQGMGTNRTDVNKAAVSTWERGSCSPNVSQLRLLCERLNVSADYLLGFKD